MAALYAATAFLPKFTYLPTYQYNAMRISHRPSRVACSITYHQQILINRTACWILLLVLHV